MSWTFFPVIMAFHNGHNLKAGADPEELRNLLRESQVFSILSDKELTHCLDRLQFCHFTLGQPVCRAGDVAAAFFIVYSGRARVLAVREQNEEVTVGTLTRGDSFGEQGLLTDARRHYTVRAASDLSLLQLSRTDFEKLLEAHPQLRAYFTQYISENSIRNFLKLCTVFAPLAPAEICELLKCLTIREVTTGEAIIREGEPGDAFYIVRNGNLTVVKESEGGKALNRLREGDVFGELALLTGQPRAASVVADTPTSVFRLDKSDFDQLIKSAPKVRDAIISLAAGYSVQALQVTEQQAASSPSTTPELRPAPLPANDYRPRHARRYPALLQLSEMDCGAAALAMILRFYRRHVSINRLRDLANVSREGASLYSLAVAAESLGFRTRGLRAAYEHLPKIQLPAIAHWEGRHFIVLYEARPDRVVIADPAIGLRRLTREEFNKGWTGHLIELTPTPQIESVEESKTTLGRFLPLLKPYRRLLLEIFLASFVIQLFGLASPIFMQVIVDKVLVHKSVPMLNLMLIGMLIVAVFQTLTVALRYYLMVHTTRRIDLEMVVGFYRQVLSLPMRYFEERKVGDILKRFSENRKVREMLTGRALGVVLDCLMILACVGLMLYYNARLTLVALAFLPGYALLTLVVTPIMQRQSRETFQREAEAESHMVEAVSAMNTVKATAAERRIRWKWEGLMVRALNVQFRSALTSIGAYSTGSILQTLSTTLLLWYGAHLVITDELSVGQLMAFNVLVGSVTHPMLNLIEMWHDFQEVRVALERLNDVFEAKPEEDLARKALINLPPVRGQIRFENVTFRYPTRGDRNALQNINLEIYPGQTVALIGRSGAGKTTFASLLLRLHEPNSGRIFIDGLDLRQVSVGSLRSQIGVVPQDVFLFSGTIRENIAFGDPDAPLAEVAGAAMLAGAHDFISELPLGYETIIGERGQSLSGGQKQRVAIARALFKKPRILIFDEATSALDAESERAIQQNLENILKDRTTLVIAHRLSTVKKADLIVVLDHGEVVETGTHYSLMEQHGLYYYLNRQQLES